MKYMVKVAGERNYTVEFNTENERLNWLNKNAQQFEELDGKWLTNFYNDEVELIETEDNKEEETMTTTTYTDKNAAVVLEYVEDMIARYGIDYKTIYIDDVYDTLSIFDWWKDTLSLSNLKDMRKFLREAVKLGYTGYVCFKVGSTGCSNGMWAYKAESTTGHSPDGEALYKSFTPAYNYWAFSDSDNNWFPAGDADYDSLKTIKDLETALSAFLAQEEAEAEAEAAKIEEVIEDAPAVETKSTTVKVNIDRYNSLILAVAYALKDMDVDLCEYGTDSCGGTLRWDVNWSALGSKTPAEAVKFAEDLRVAANMAEALNDMHMEMVWENDEALNSLIAEDREEASRRLMNFKWKIVDQLTEITALDPASYDRLYELMDDYTI